MQSKINCVVVDDEPMAREILSSYIAKIPSLHLLKECGSAMEAFEVANNEKVDLFFLDINMPEISGLTLAKSIHKNAKIIFTTAYREFAVDGFDLHAVDYLLKPISFERLLEAVNKYFEITPSAGSPEINAHLEKENDFIFVRSDRKMIKIDFAEILFIESISDYIKIHLSDKTIVTRETISNIETKLPSNGFLRVHRSFIISISKITSYTNEYIEVNKKAIPLSRSYKDEVLKKLQDI